MGSVAIGSSQMAARPISSIGDRKTRNAKQRYGLFGPSTGSAPIAHMFTL